jgi:GT2 family glycosyltransferase
MNSTPLLVSVILNTNRRDDTLECLAALQKSTYPRNRTIVLDNASTDGSVEAIRLAHPEVEVVDLDENLGYAGNNNVGIDRALREGADWVVLLNEDTVPDPECLRHMVAVGAADPGVGVIGPLVFHFDSPKIVQSAGGILNRHWKATHIGQNERDNGSFAEPRDVDWISGCCIMVRREVFEDVGPLDERFFYYWEETELCIRARRRGWRIVHVPAAQLWHKGVQVDYQPAPSVTYYATRNRLLTLSKHRAPLMARLMTWAELTRTLLSWTLRPKWGSLAPHREAMWRGIQDYRLGRWGKMPDRSIDSCRSS